MLVVLIMIGGFIAGSMGVFNYVKDLKSGTKVELMTLNNCCISIMWHAQNAYMICFFQKLEQGGIYYVFR